MVGREEPPTRLLGFEQIESAVTAHASHFDRRDVVQAVAAAFLAGAPVGDVEAVTDSFLAHSDVLAIGQSAKGERFTTRRIWELEKRALATAEGMAGQGTRGVAGALVVHRVIGSRPALKRDQTEMVRRLLTSGSGIDVVIGEAGTGKTYATLAAAEGWAQIKRDLAAEAHRFYVLDEFTYPLTWGWVDVDDVVEALTTRPGRQHVVITGRNADPRLIAAADLVTEMGKVKHPMDVGQKGQRGIEW